MREVLIKKHYEITEQLLLQLWCCASSNKNNPDLQRSLENFSFDLSKPKQTTTTGEGINTSRILSLIFQHRCKQLRQESGSTLLANFPFLFGLFVFLELLEQRLLAQLLPIACLVGIGRAPAVAGLGVQGRISRAAGANPFVHFVLFEHLATADAMAGHSPLFDPLVDRLVAYIQTSCKCHRPSAISHP